MRFLNISYSDYIKIIYVFFFIIGLNPQLICQQKSIARQWNELVLDAIRKDFARPTIHARNLFHTSIAMYDSWAMFDDTADTYLIGNEKKEFRSSFDFDDVENLRAQKDLNKTISFAIYRIIIHRYKNAPRFEDIKRNVDNFMMEMGYDIFYNSFDYSDGDAASLGNFIGLEIIQYGLKDGANEQNEYENRFYEPVNPALDPRTNSTVVDIDPNRWQPLFFNNFIDQSGNPLPSAIPEFLGPNGERLKVLACL